MYYFISFTVYTLAITNERVLVYLLETLKSLNGFLLDLTLRLLHEIK